MTRNPLPPDAAKRLLWPLRLTWAGMVCEQAVRGLWPLLTVLMSAAAFLMSGLPDLLANGWLIGAAILCAALVVASLAYLIRSFRLPSRFAALQRLDATLPGQPIAVLTDEQAIGTGDQGSEAVWSTHRARMAARLEAAKAPTPDLRVSSRDPHSLRLMALVAFVMTLGFGSWTHVGGIDGLAPGGAAQAGLAAASWEGWVEPPAYTGKPSLYLNDQKPGALAVPQGSRLTLRLYGRLGDITISEDVSGIDRAQPAAQATHVFQVTRNGTLKIEGPDGGEWAITATPDARPEIHAQDEMTRTLSGELRQRFLARDDYGLVHGQATIALDLPAIDRRHGLSIAPEPRAPIEVDLPMPYRGDRRALDEELVENLSEHAWANLPVRLTLSVTDAVDQVGMAAGQTLILPGRRFLDPLSLALIEQRRDLLWSRENGRRAAQILRAVSHRPDGLFQREVTYLKLRVLVRRLELGVRIGLTGEKRDEIAQALWDIAVQIEDGNLADARERLRRAQDRLSEAMRQGASEEELSELMDELRQAMDDFMNQLAQQTPQDGANQQAQNPNMQQITPEDLQAMMDQIEELMKEGRQDEAQAMLDAMQEMMENMQVAEGQPGEGSQSPGEQAMEGLKDSLRQQQGLSDEAFRDLQERADPSAQAGESEGNVGRDGGLGRGQSHTGQGGQGQGDGADGDLADRQRSLGDAVDEQRRNLPGAGTQEGDAARGALDQAGRAMDEASDNLEEGDLAGALDKQAEAMEALREGMRQLDDAIAEAQRNPQGQQGASSGQPGSRQRDPLGRDPAGSGAAATQAPLADGEDVYRRAQELMQELRRRSGDGARPDLERDYLKRLLDRF